MRVTRKTDSRLSRVYWIVRHYFRGTIYEFKDVYDIIPNETGAGIDLNKETIKSY